MKICVDPQGNFNPVTAQLKELALSEPNIFSLVDVADADYLQAKADKAAGKTVKFVNNQFTIIQTSLEEIKRSKLSLIDVWTRDKIVGGFVSSVTGSEVTFDSDTNTQLTMQGIALNCQSALFVEKYPNGCPVRGYAAGSLVKTKFYLTGDMVLAWWADLSIHIGTCKQLGWAKQELVNSAECEADLELITLD